ncbi:MAG: NUMOD4 domain-containing protein [Cellulosilyticaceae bacterium]
MSEFLVQENWKIINEFPEYEISDLGKVKNRINNKINSGSINAAGYRIHRFYFYDASGNRHMKDVRIHLIVAQYFVENEANKALLQFLDSNKLNIAASNLAWRSEEEQPTDKSSKLSGKPVCEYDLKGRLIRIWASATAVSKVYPISSRSIHDPCMYKTKTTYGRQWRYYETTKGMSIPAIQLRPYDLNILNNKLKSKAYAHVVEVPTAYLFNPNPIKNTKESLDQLITHSSLTALQKQDLREATAYIAQLEKAICKLVVHTKPSELPEELCLLIERLHEK